jgi:tRNA (cmo5U34)-methyltransferase
MSNAFANERTVVTTDGLPPAPPPAQSSSLGHMPSSSRWEFDASVTNVFDDMLARSIPQIRGMRQTIDHIAPRFVQPGTDIVDLGCSLGAAMAPFVERFGRANRFVGIEASVPMVTTCRERFKSFIEEGVVDIRLGDLRDVYPEVDASLTLCVLTLMFTPIEHRFRILADGFRHTRPGGAFILVEKVLGEDPETNATLTSLYHDYKRSMGYSDEEIDRKRLSLEGVLVPVTTTWNEQMLQHAGFRHVECFWRCLNFCGLMAIKDR